MFGIVLFFWFAIDTVDRTCVFWVFFVDYFFFLIRKFLIFNIRNKLDLQ